MSHEDLTIPEPSGIDIPEPFASFLEDADERIREFFARHPDRPIGGFVPSDYPSVYSTLAGLIELGFDPGIFCEWGSGYGVITGIASLLGHDAHGVELDPELVEYARDLLDDHDLSVEIHQGSYVPDGYDETVSMTDEGILSVIPGASAYDDMDLRIEDFDTIFVFPWPGTEPMHYELFDRYASPGTILVTHHGEDGTRVRRKLR